VSICRSQNCLNIILSGHHDVKLSEETDISGTMRLVRDLIPDDGDGSQNVGFF
jgi:hypothetical protein